jgi:hypothetical protein
VVVVHHVILTDADIAKIAFALFLLLLLLLLLLSWHVPDGSVGVILPK